MKVALITERSLWLAFIILLASSGINASQSAGAGNPPEGNTDFKATTVFLVRHAEKSDAPPQDPALSSAGVARSETLARMLAGSKIKAIYTSQYLRTRQTAEPLAKRLGITAVPVQLSIKQGTSGELSEESLRTLIAGVEEHAGEAVLIVGHSNSIPAVIGMLGGDVVPKIEESSFDDLFIVTVYDRGRAKVAHLNYGSME